MLRREVITFIIFLGVFFSLNIHAQKNNIKEDKIDAVFSRWNQKKAPGVAGAIINNKAVIYQKGFGVADIEKNIPITINTRFNIHNLSKQFTVLAILQLEQDGKISFKDDIRKFIPQLPEYKLVVTINHLLNHSSGLNDYWVVKSLTGYMPADAFTHQKALNIIGAQKELSFIPGTAFSSIASATELTLLAEIVAKASNKSFSDYLREYIFIPLQMNDSFVNRDVENIIFNLGKPYRKVGDRYNMIQLKDETIGVSNVYSSIQDLSKWYLNFTLNSNNGLTSLIKKLDNPVRLKNGKTNDTPNGRMTLGREYLHGERGIYKIWQYGLTEGYGTNVFRFLDDDFTSIVVGNNNSYNGMPAMLNANLFLEDKFTEPVTIDFSTLKTKKLSERQLKKYEGFYWNSKRGIARKVFYKNDSLHFSRINRNIGVPLASLSKKDFQFVLEGDDKIVLTFNKNSFGIVNGESDPSFYVKYIPKHYHRSELQEFTGTYMNKNLGVVFSVKPRGDSLVFSNLNNGEILFSPVKENIFTSETGYFRSVEFTENKKSFKVTTDGIKDLFFLKIDGTTL